MSSLGSRTLMAVLCNFALVACTPPAGPEEETAEGPEALSRTEFTDRIENFFEYDPLVAGEPSQFLIHLTDLSDGSPISQAEVDLSVTTRGTGMEVASTRALVGRVTGIYVAELTVPEPGTYDIRFDVRAGAIDESMPLGGFEVR